MYLKNSMKKIISTILVSIMFSQIYSQPKNSLFMPKFDNGYYSGLCIGDNNNKFDRYLFIQFLSNDGDSILSTVPYDMVKNDNVTVNKKNYDIMNNTVNKYLDYLYSSVVDIEYTCININSWTIKGFDNYSYYELKTDSLSFSLNIVDTETEETEVFYFNGNIKKNGEEIEAVIYSDKNTFKKGNIVLKYKSNNK